MSDQQAHTPEDQWTDYENDLPRALNRADYSRAVACVKGCAGLNPAGVKDAIREIEIRAKEINEGYDGAEESFNIATARAAAREILAILAKIREGS